MSDKRSSQKVDLVSQYISQVLIPRLNRANNLYSQGRYVEAVDAQIQIIKTLYRADEEEKKLLVEWTERFNTITNKADQEKGNAQVFTTYKKIGKLNRLAKNLYDELEWEIWSYLHELGYFKTDKSYGLTRAQLNAVEIQEE